jgi:hypothetical protein
MRYRRFVPAFDGLSLRIAPSSLAGVDTSALTATAVAPASTSVAGTSIASTAAVSTSLSASSWSPYTCAVPTTALNPYVSYAD